MRILAISATMAVGLLTLPAQGVIRHPADDAVTFSMPDPLVVGLWNSNASAVAIGPNHAITTRHQGGGVGSTVTFGGSTYDVAEVHNIGSVDLRVVRLEAGGNPANLTQWVNVFDGDDSNLSQQFVMGGYGRVRGDTLTVNGEPYGYQWGSGPASESQWGQNIIEGANPGISTTGPNNEIYDSAVLIAFFDGPESQYAVPGEAILAQHDSGGGWFVWNNDEWQVRALSLGVNHTSPNPNPNPYDNRALFASHLDASVAAPDVMGGVRLAQYHDDIYQVIPEPSSALILLLGGASLMIRRRRSA